MGRAPCCEKVGLNRGPWTRDEDMRLIQYIKAHGEGCWRTLPKAAGLLRCGKSCRLRWINYLRPDLKRGNISEEEDRLIIKLHSLLGNRWSLIAGNLPGRTDNEIKNYWNTHLKKKLCNMGIDPQSHLPLSQEKSSTIINSSGMTSIPNSLNNKKHNYNVNPLTHQLNASLISSTNQLNKINNSVISSKVKPLDMNPFQIDTTKSIKTLPFDTPLASSNISCPPCSSLLATTHDNPPPLDNFLSYPSSSSISGSIVSTFDHSMVDNYTSKCSELTSSSLTSLSSSSSPLSMPTLTNSSINCDIESFSMLRNIYPNPSQFSAPNESLINYNYSFSLPSSSSSLVMSSTTSLSSSSLPSPPLLMCASSSLATTRTSSSSLSCFPFMDALMEASYIGYHNKSISKTLDGAKFIEYNNECMKKLEGMMDEVQKKERDDDGSYDCGKVDLAKHESIMKECGLSLLEGEFMWDMEIMCSFEEVGSPTRSSMLTCSSSYSLWGHDTSNNNEGGALQTWLNEGDDH